jgi:sugar-specific transcriptional regulator TrmB
MKRKDLYTDEIKSIDDKIALLELKKSEMVQELKRVKVNAESKNPPAPKLLTLDHFLRPMKKSFDVSAAYEGDILDAFDDRIVSSQQLKTQANPVRETQSQADSNVYTSEIMNDASLQSILSKKSEEENKEDGANIDGLLLRQHWSGKVIAKALESLKKYTPTVVHMMFGSKIPYRTLIYWKNRGTSERKVGSGKKVICEELDSYVFEAFLKQRSRKLPVTEALLREQGKKFAQRHAESIHTLNPELYKKLKDFKASNGWIEKFKRRFSIVRRQTTTTTSEDLLDIKKAVDQFYLDLDRELHEKKLTLLVNMDEVGIFFDMESNSTLDIKGKKIVSVYASSKSKQRVTVCLIVTSKGHTLPPVIIVKSESRYQNTQYFPKAEEVADLVEKTNACIVHNRRAWNNTDVMTKFIIPHINKHLPKKERALLLLDNCSSHINPETLTSMEMHRMEHLFLPANTTSILQPVDVGMAKIVKNDVRRRYLEWVTTNYEELLYENSKNQRRLRNPTTDDILCWIINSCLSVSREQASRGNHF